jgi:YD repeat-containing protein
MKQVRIFVSSPRDVGSERAIALRAIERLQLEFRSRVELRPVFWEHEVLKATETFQAQIPRPSRADLCVFILWSWFGTPLPESFARPDGSRYRSGTEFEFEDAVRSYRDHGTPDILVYRKVADVPVPTRDRARELEWRAQRDALHEFIDRWFRGEGGTFKAAFHEFESQQQFEDAFENHLRRWIEERLRAEAGGPEAVEPPLWHGSPFRGLERFDFEHALIFCGRTQAVAEAIEALSRQAEKGTPFLLVAGMSGAGKSSLVRAGLLPMLIEPRVIEGDIAWRRAVLRPGDVPGAPLESLATAVLADGALPELLTGGITGGELAALLGERPEAALPTLSLALASAAQTRPGKPAEAARLLLFVDQLDEIFTQANVTAETRNAFANALAVLARSGKVWVISTLRSDLFGRIADLPAAFAELARGDGFYELRAPSPAEIGQMIRRPARMAGLVFERRPDTDEGLDDVLRDAAAAQPASLPLLQFALDELQKACGDGKVLTFAAYAALGGLEGALRRTAEATFAALSPAAQASLSAVLARLVQVRLDGALGQMRAPKAALEAIVGAKEFVDAFVDARLFVVDRGADGEPVVGVAHEALLREWPRVGAWIEDNRSFLNVRARIAAAQALWVAAERGAMYLLPRGRLLQEAESLLTAHRELLSAEEAAFIELSLARAARERRAQRLRWTAAAVLALVAGAGALAYWDAYARDHIVYSRNLIKRWGVFEPGDVVTEAQARARNFTWRIHSRGRFGPVWKMEAVNGLGFCPQVARLALYIGGNLADLNYTSRRPCSWEFELDANGRARVERGLDVMGRQVYMMRYSDKDATTAEYYSAVGFTAAGAGSGASRVVFGRILEGPGAGRELLTWFMDAYGRARPGTLRIYAVRYEYDVRGRFVGFTNLDADGRPARASNGTIGERMQLTDSGGFASAQLVDGAGQPTTRSDGVSRVDYSYDAVGNREKTRYVEIDGKPSRHIAEERIAYDPHGNRVLEQYFDADGRLTRLRNGAAQRRWKYDDRGQVEELTYLDEDGNPVLITDGHAIVRDSYDNDSNIVRREFLDTRGNLIERVERQYSNGFLEHESYWDGSGRPHVRGDGYAGLHISYREGREIERVFLDAGGHPVRTKQGYAKLRTSHDVHGNAVETAYLDEDDRPILNADGYARVTRRFSDPGDPEEEIFFDLDDQPRLTANGYAKIRRRYDGMGRPLEISYFNAADRPVWPKDGCSSRHEYDDFGRLTAETCIDAEGKPARSPHGWVRSEYRFDALGNPDRLDYRGADGTPIRGDAGFASIVRRYDPWGNPLNFAYLDEHGRPVKAVLGCYQNAYAYNRRNQVVEHLCFDGEGNPLDQDSGVYRSVSTYDDLARLAHRTDYFGTGRTFARLDVDYDEKGRIIKEQYLDKSGHAAFGPYGYAGMTKRYDAEQVETSFIDERGAPVVPAIRVRSVVPDSQASRIGLQPGDIVLRYAGRDVSVVSLPPATRSREPGPRELLVMRERRLLKFEVQPGPIGIDMEWARRPSAEDIEAAEKTIH